MLARFRLYETIPGVVPLPGRSAGRPQKAGGAAIETFFAFGALAAVAGVGLGAYLWLVLNGEAALTPAYLTLRRAHVYVQLFLFFGAFVLGFLLQAAPRLLQVPRRPVRHSPALLLLLLAGTASAVTDPAAVWPRSLLAAPPALLAWQVAPLVIAARPELRERFGAWIASALIASAAAAFLEIERPVDGLCYFWLATVPASLGTEQQFLAAFCGGRYPNRRQALLLFAGYLAVAGALLYGRHGGAGPSFRLAGGLAGLQLAAYAAWTGMANAFKRSGSSPLALALSLGTVWALVGAALLAAGGDAYADLALHAWAIGWMFPLILAISAQVLRSAGAGFALGDGAVWCLILLWQIVPLGRAGLHLTAAGGLPLTVAAVSVLVVVTWGGAVLFAARAALRSGRA